eukprot:3073982-Prymnesium_polylepis.2
MRQPPRACSVPSERIVDRRRPLPKLRHESSPVMKSLDVTEANKRAVRACHRLESAGEGRDAREARAIRARRVPAQLLKHLGRRRPPRCRGRVGVHVRPGTNLVGEPGRYPDPSGRAIPG